ncbi:MAG TPA: heavy-metal-associated domain-containing protein, partial [Gemmatimonadales bacterium]|nr:heavy-metal-associated domain-containing protein [Gemmatimonadales bacterium]
MREAILEALGMLRGSTGPALQSFLMRQRGVHHAAANPAGDTVTVHYDEALVTKAELRRYIEQCGLHCRGEVVPRHLCSPAGQGEMAQMAHEMGHGAGMG